MANETLTVVESTQEATKDTTRMLVLGAISTIATYFLNKWLPGTPELVVGAMLTLILIGADSFIHHFKPKVLGTKLRGLVPF